MNTKKMPIIEHDFIDKMTHQQNENKATPRSRLDLEMEKIMSSKLLDREKWALYQQILQRYLHFFMEERQPQEITITEKTVNDKTYDDGKRNLTVYENENEKWLSGELPPSGKDVSLQLTTKDILNLIPKTYIKKGELLMESIQKHSEKLNWNKNGTVVVSGKEIPGSNIIDLVNDALKPSKKADPIGWESFSKFLNDINIPLTYIGNLILS
ncbi:unnamed protein product [Pieris macdunnoughi]|uniref:Uncharacterized protein n=1 Tax=Pieris macdunnoughi TaxID=345717 RepID=A0A821T299_9NEOP|nr:unnamed protein product [Pieris macdunnoughi]